MSDDGASTALVGIAVNGRVEPRSIPVHRLLREFLREDLGLTGTKAACDDGMCGACTVLVGDDAVKSCLVLAVEMDGEQVTTVEGLGTPQALHPIQRALADHFAVQCGFCTPGFVMTIEALLRAGFVGTAGEMGEALAGNICRCTGYVRIVEAAMAAVEERHTGGAAR
jgi:aerobic-type carbon monoxide dehydrogenase small subunit (CoxS/CutS family)